MNWRNLGITVVLTVIASITVLYWLVNNDTTESFIPTIIDEYRQLGIKNVNIVYSNKVLLLNVTLDKPMTCKQVVDALDIGNLPLKDKIYSPVCTVVDSSLIVISYKEK